MDVGAELRDAREKSGLSVEALSRATKIRVATLRALERNDLTALPASVFVRGFIRGYAREVGLDPEATARRYFAQFEPGTVAFPADGDLRGDTSDPGWVPPTTAAPPSPVSVTQLIVLALLVTLAALAYFVLPDPAPVAVVPAEAPQPTTPDPVRNDAAAVPRVHPVVPASATVQEPGVQAAAGLHLEFRVTGTCWVSAAADGTRVVYRLVHPGESHSIEAREEIVLRVGAPAVFSYVINGKAGRPLGLAGQPTTVRMTTGTVAEFAAP